MKHISQILLVANRVLSVYDNWQSIFEDPPDALNPQRRNHLSPADYNQEPQYCSEATTSAVANKLIGAEESTPVDTAADDP